MPDHDWVRYKRVRGKPLPETWEWNGANWRLADLLKYDFYAATGLYEPAEGQDPHTPHRAVLFKVYHTDRWGPLPLGWLGRRLCRREAHFLETLNGVEGIPRFFGRHGESGLVREFVAGKNLRDHGKFAGLRDDFFPRLRAIVAEVHRRGIAHNDLSKPENVLVDSEGGPILIDFQIALGLLENPRTPQAALRRRLIKHLQMTDLYHLRKLHRRFRPFDFTTEELAAARRKSWSVHAHGWIRRPYRRVRHWILDRFLTQESADN